MVTWMNVITQQGGRALSVLLLSSVSVAAQDGGQQLVFGVSQSLSYQTNPNLTPGGDDAAALSTTNLSFAFRDDTRVDSFALTAASGLRLGDTTLSTIISPTLGLSYSRESADARLSASANWSRTNIEEAATLTDFVTEDGVLDLPADFDLLDPVLDGTRTATTAQALLETGLTTPLSYRLSVKLDQITYGGDAALVLDDTQTLALGLGAELRIDPVTQGRITLSYTQFDTDADGEDTARWGLNTSLQRDTPRGPVTLSFRAQEVAEGVRLSMDTSRDITLPRTNLTFGAGLSRSASDSVDITGRFQGRTALPTGAISYGVSQEFTAVNSGTDTRVSRINGALEHQITPTEQIDVSFTYLQSRSDTATSERAEITASYSYALTPDWNLQAGVSVNAQQQSGEEETRNESVFVTLSRQFTTRP